MGETTIIGMSDWIKVAALGTIYFAVVIAFQWQVFSISYPLSEYEHRYSESQYVKGDQHTMLMGDGDIYAYAGIRYFKGEDPTKINFEHTPLIKYFFGLSYSLSGIPNGAVIPLFYVGLFSFWYLSQSLIATRWIQWLSLILFLGHSTIYVTIPQTMLDFPMTAMMLFALARFLILFRVSTYKNAVLFGIASGCMLLSKYPFPLLALLLLLLLGYLAIHARSVKLLSLAAITVIAVYMLGYVVFFLRGNSLIDFLRFEWWRWQWFSGKTDNPKGMIWQTIFLGRYPKWWLQTGEYQILPHWTVLSPLSVMLFAASLSLKKLWRHPLFPYQIWIVLSLAAYSFGAAEDRFLVPLIPGFALFGGKVVEKLFTREKNGIIKQ